MKKMIWVGRIMTGIVMLFLLFDVVIHLMVIPPVVDSFSQLGLPIDLSVEIGIIELACLILYIIRRTSFLGAILQTGYLGGAIAIQLRVLAPPLQYSFVPSLYWSDPLGRALSTQ
jgi:hypothetical protein